MLSLIAAARDIHMENLRSLNQKLDSLYVILKFYVTWQWRLPPLIYCLITNSPISLSFHT